jgi:hypothetical protein
MLRRQHVPIYIGQIVPTACPWFALEHIGWHKCVGMDDRKGPGVMKKVASWEAQSSYVLWENDF